MLNIRQAESQWTDKNMHPDSRERLGLIIQTWKSLSLGVYVLQNVPLLRPTHHKNSISSRKTHISLLKVRKLKIPDERQQVEKTATKFYFQKELQMILKPQFAWWDSL